MDKETLLLCFLVILYLVAINYWPCVPRDNLFTITSSSLCLSLLQHVPKINGQIPSVDEATSDHQRLSDRYCARSCTTFVVAYSLWRLYFSCKMCYSVILFQSIISRSYKRMSEISTFQSISGRSLFCTAVLNSCSFVVCVRLQLYDLVELKISGDGNCQVGSFDISAPLSSQYGMF